MIELETAFTGKTWEDVQAMLTQHPGQPNAFTVDGLTGLWTSRVIVEAHQRVGSHIATDVDLQRKADVAADAAYIAAQRAARGLPVAENVTKLAAKYDSGGKLVLDENKRTRGRQD